MPGQQYCGNLPTYHYGEPSADEMRVDFRFRSLCDSSGFGNDRYAVPVQAVMVTAISRITRPPLEIKLQRELHPPR